MQIRCWWLLALAGLALACACKPSSTAQSPGGRGGTASNTAQGTAAAARVTPLPATPRATVKMGGLGGAIDAPLFVGQAEGYFDEVGIDVQVTTFRSLSEMIPLLATGKLDAGHGSTNPGFFNAAGSGIDTRIVSNVNVPIKPGPGIKNSQFVIVRKDLAAQVKGAADLKGRKVAINNTGTLSEFQLDTSLQANGLAPSDLTVQAVPFPEMVTALANKAVDAAVEIEPFVTQAEDQGIAVPIYDVAEALPGHPGQYLFFGPNLAQSHPEVGERFMAAYLKSMRYIQDAWLTGKNRDAVVDLHVKNTPLKDPALWQRMGMGYYETECSVNTQALSLEEDFYAQKGLVQKKVDPEKITDLRFCTYARGVLGPFQK